MRSLEERLRAGRAAGRKLLVPYVTGGVDGWEDAIRAAALAGADAVEVGIPFSDPVIDGPVIQAASQKALEAGATPASFRYPRYWPRTTCSARSGRTRSSSATFAASAA